MSTPTSEPNQAGAPRPADPTSPAASTGLSARPPKVLRFSDLLVGLLPMLGIAAVVGVLLWENTRPLTPRYEARLRTYLAENKFGEAYACVRRLLTLNPERNDLKFSLAELHLKLGRYEEAEQIIRTLARPDTPGYLPAHLWLAARLTPHVEKAPVVAREAEGDLKILLKSAPNSPELKVALGKVYARTKRPKEAIGLLAEYAAGDPSIQLTLARCWDQAGSDEQAKRYRDEAIATCRKITAAKPKEPAAWLLWSQALAAERNYNEAYQVLDQGRKAVGSAVLDSACGDLCTEWAGRVWKTPPRLGNISLRPPSAGETAEPLRVVLLGLNADPGHARLTDQLMQLVTTAGDAGKQARERVEELAKAGGRSGAVARYVLGNVAFLQKNHEEAARQWAMGYVLAPDLTVLANNHAYALATARQPDPRRALEVIDAAMKIDNRDPRLRFTRGDILARLGRDAEAESELTAALDQGCKDPELPKVLASVRTRRKGVAGAASASRPGPT